jgi:hypothetical protein
MTVVSWVASDTASWILFSTGVLSAALAIVKNARREQTYTHNRSLFRILAAWFLIMVGPVLLLGGAVLVAIGAGRLSWLSILSGAICLSVIASSSRRGELGESRSPLEAIAGTARTTPGKPAERGVPAGDGHDPDHDDPSAHS